MAAHDDANVDTPLQPPLEEVIDIGTDLWMRAEVFFDSMFRTWNLYQLLIALAVFAAAHVLRAILGPRIRAWMGARKNWPKGRMRILAWIHQRLRAIFFVVLIWAVILVMREVTWPSRSYILGVIGTLAFAWLAIAFATRLIKSPTLRKFVRYGPLTCATLLLLELLAGA